MCGWARRCSGSGGSTLDSWLKNLEYFERTWLKALNQDSVQVTFKMGRLVDPLPDPQTVADEFIAKHGYQRIAPYWRTLEHGVNGESAIETTSILTEVLAKDLVYPDCRWLTPEDASKCAEDFACSFKEASGHFLTNRIGNGWNPIGDWTMEWAFVGFDNAKIALLLLQAED